MKKLALLFALTLFFAANSLGGEGVSGKDGRILHTPEDRLAGHWTNELEEHYYYGPVTNGTGSYIIVTPGGKTVSHQYEVVSQQPAGERIVVRLVLRNGKTREETYAVSRDGRELKKTTMFRGMEVTTLRSYVDDRIKP